MRFKKFNTQFIYKKENKCILGVRLNSPKRNGDRYEQN